MKYYIKASSIFLEDSIINDAYLEIVNGKFGQISSNPDNNFEIIDYSDKIIAPGFVDTHIHGSFDCDIMDKKTENVIKMSENLINFGVTSFLPTTLTDSIENTKEACKCVYEASQKTNGAKIQGIFLEGPFFTEKYKGAQNPKFFVEPDIKYINDWQSTCGNLIKKVSVAPEIKNAVKFTKDVTNNGLSCALGHSAATYDEARACLNAGANIFVHTFNGMSPLHHREPGMVGAALESDAYLEVICDGHHLNKACINIIKKCTGSNKLILVTDCMRAGGMPEGMYNLGEFDVTVKDGTARLSSGSLAGSILTMNKAVENMVNFGIASLFEAVKMATINPARSAKIDNLCGKITIGNDADFVILNKDATLSNVYLNGIKRK